MGRDKWTGGGKGGEEEGRKEGKGMSCYENDSHEDTGARWPTFCRPFLDSSRYLVSNKLHILLLVKEGKAIKGSR